MSITTLVSERAQALRIKGSQGTLHFLAACFGASLLSITTVQSQISPPPNDDYTNRITLTGTDITFTGTLAGATFELAQNEPLGQLGGASQSVWWEWTPTQSVAVTVQVLSTSSKPTINRSDALEVYTIDYSAADNAFYSRSFVGGSIVDTNTPKWFFSFTAQAGTNYEIQLVGDDSASFTMRLLATNPPLILEPPKNQTITIGDSVLFTVLAAGAQKPFSYQWQF